VKFKSGLMKEYVQKKEAEKEQKKLKAKHNIEDENVIVVEKKFFLKFMLLILIGVIKTTAFIALLILASLGLLTLLYPEPREELLFVLNDIYSQIREFTGF